MVEIGTAKIGKETYALKWSTLRAAFGTTLCLSALTALRVCADTPSDKTPPPTKQKSQDSQPPAPASNVDKESGVALRVEEKPSPDKDVLPDRHLSRGDLLARTALTYRGAPYRFGGQSARTGFDCSGLVQAVFSK